MTGLIDAGKFKEFQDERKARTIKDPSLRQMIQRAKIRLVRDQLKELKEARVGEFTLTSDEATARGGGGTAPGPLTYFVAAVGF
jgi:hypothetical protein